MAPALCEQILTRSLTTQGFKEIPGTSESVTRWLEAGLKPLVLNTVGADAAELLERELAPLVMYAASLAPEPSIEIDEYALTPPTGSQASLVDKKAQPVGSAPSAQSEKRKRDDTLRIYTLPAPPMPSLLSQSTRDDTARIVVGKPNTAPSSSRAPQTGKGPHDVASERVVALPRVLTASRNEQLTDALQRYLAGTASVVPVSDLASLLDALEEREDASALVLMDCKQPSVHLASIAAMRDDLPAGTTVLVWGPDESSWALLSPENTQTARWVRCAEEATPDDVGSLCSMLLG